MKQIRLLLAMLMAIAFVPQAWAANSWTNTYVETTEVTINEVTYVLCHEYTKTGYISTDWLSPGYQEGSSVLEETYYASVVGITGTGEIVIPEVVTNGDHEYQVMYIGAKPVQKHTTEERSYSYVGLFGNVNSKTTCHHYSVSFDSQSVENSGITGLTVNPGVKVLGELSASSCASVVFKKDVTISADVNFSGATEMTFDGAFTIDKGKTLLCNSVEELKFNYIKHIGVIACQNLKDIYFQTNIPSYSGSFSDYFTVDGNNVTAHVVNKTEEECATMKNTWAVYSSFGAIVPYYSEGFKHDVVLVLTAGECDKSLEVWKDGELLVGSVSSKGGTIYKEIDDVNQLQLRIPNEYLKTITVDNEDVTTTLTSTTPDDSDYEGYTFYTLYDLKDVTVVDVAYTYSLLSTTSIQFELYGLNATGSIKNTKIYFEDGTYYSDAFGTLGLSWEDKKVITRIEVTMVPDVDNFTYAEQNNTLGTLTNNGDGTYTYDIPGQNLTSSVIPLWFPTSNFGNVKTLIRSKNDIKLGYYFGEWVNIEGGFLPNYDQSNSSLLNSDVTVMHYDTWKAAEWGGYSIGIVYVQVPQGTDFRLIESGSDETSKCYWHNANESFSEVANDPGINYTCPVDGYYYLQQNVASDSYIIVDDGSTPLDEISSPWQAEQTVTCYGPGVMSLRDSEGNEVSSVGEGDPVTASWAVGTELTLAVALPEGADIANYEALLLIDGTIIPLQKVDNAFATLNMGDVTAAHNIILVTRQTGGFETPDIIEFADANVKAICVAHWDTDGDGELSKEEAAAVTTLRVLNEDRTVYASPFKSNTEITSFDELQYFTGLTEIADSAFYHCEGLKSVIVPQNVTKLNERCFERCLVLESVQMPEGLLTIDQAAFWCCVKLAEVNIPSTVTTLGNQSFSQCNVLRSVKLPSSLTSMGNAFFHSQALQSIHIPAKVERFISSSTPISDCTGISSVSVDANNRTFDSREGCNAVIMTSTNTLVMGCKTTRIPESVVAIGAYAFHGMPFTSIDVPEGITSIKACGFDSCRELDTVTLPSTLTELERFAFSYCNKLTSVVAKMETPINIATMQYKPFTYMTSSNCKLTVPKGTRDAYIAAGWTEEIFKGGIEEAEPETSGTPGDINGDGSVTIADVTKLVNIILGKE